MRRVALIIDSLGSYGRDLLLGIARFVRTHVGWEVVYEERKTLDALPGWLSRDCCDGILARVRDTRQLAALRRLSKPMISLGELAPKLEGIPEIFSDHQRIGRMAAEHLIERQLRHFAFYGSRGGLFSDLRFEGFRQYLESQQHRVYSYLADKWDTGIVQTSRRSGPYWEDPELAAWLTQLPKPLGVFACNDYFGRLLLNVCQHSGLHVPNEIAVLGVDNDPILCDLSMPALASIDPGADDIGFRAAEILDEIFNGRDSAMVGTVFLPPKSVVARASTNIIAAADPVVVSAMQFIRDKGGIAICIEDVLDHLSKVGMLVSRSTLERKFHVRLKLRPHDAIVQARLEQIERLLISTSYPLTHIAGVVGMAAEQQLVAFFRRYRGMTPGSFRRKYPANQSPGSVMESHKFLGKPSAAAGRLHLENPRR